jgi:hypothetical protein
MTQVITVVRHALRLLRVIDAETVPEAQQAEDAIDALNRMMTRWEADGLALGWQNVSLPESDMPTDPMCDEAIGYNLAIRLQPEYGVSLSPAVIAGAASGLASLRADMLNNRLYITTSPDLPLSEGQGFGSGWQAGLNG